MATNTTHTSDTALSLRGSTASSATPSPRWPGAPPGTARQGDEAVPRHPLGDMLRAIGVFADTAFRVVVLGTDGTRQPDAPQEASVPRRGEGRTGRHEPHRSGGG